MRFKLSYFILLSMCVSSLTGCKDLVEKSPFRQQMKKNAQQQSQFADRPQIKLTTYQRLKSPRQKNKYIEDKISNYIYDQMAKQQDYSDTHYLKLLKTLPQELVWLYSTAYLERELKLDGFAGYFRRTKGFLSPQAIQGYHLLGQTAQAARVQQALEQYLHSRALGKPLQAVSVEQLTAGWQQESGLLQSKRVLFLDKAIQSWQFVDTN